MSNVARLRWKCRRGTLELDLILGRFLDVYYPNLPAAQQQRFARLLEEADEALWPLVNGEASCAAELQPIVDLLRTC